MYYMNTKINKLLRHSDSDKDFQVNNNLHQPFFSCDILQSSFEIYFKILLISPQTKRIETVHF